MMESNKFSKSITMVANNKKIEREAYKNLSPRLKEILVANKDTLRNNIILISIGEILIKNSDKLKRMLEAQKKIENHENEKVI